MTIANISGTASLIRKAKAGNLTVVAGANEWRIYRDESGTPKKIATVSDSERGVVIRIEDQNVIVDR